MQVCTLPLFLKQPSLASFQFFPSDCQNNYEKIHKKNCNVQKLNPTVTMIKI